MKTDNCFHSLMHKYTMVYLPIQRRCSDKTVKTYKTALSQYRKYLLKEKNIPFSAVGFEHFKREQIYEFLTWMKDSENLSESTVNLRLAAIKAFLRYCSDEEIGLMSYYLDVKKINTFHSNKAITTIKYLDQKQLLLMYTALGYDFHIASMKEMLRVCKEIRIFPIVDLDANRTDLIKNVIDYFRKDYKVEIVKTEYEFQKGDNKLLIVRK